MCGVGQYVVSGPSQKVWLFRVEGIWWADLLAVGADMITLCKWAGQLLFLRGSVV